MLFLPYIIKVSAFTSVDANIIVFVWDMTAQPEINRMTSWFDEAYQQAPPRALKVLVGNKLDLVKERVEKTVEEEAWKEVGHDSNVVRLSCKTGEGIP